MATGDRIRLKSLITMSDEKFSSLVDAAGKGSGGAAMATILKLAKERRIMSPPRRPKGEKPRTTIRFLQRQIANLQSSCNVYGGMIQDRDKQIARQDVELSEAADAERLLASEARVYSEKYGALLGAYQNQALRLQFLEGYYHAKTETLPGAGAGHQGAYSAGAAIGEEGRQETAAGRDGGPFGDQKRRLEEDHRASDNRRSTPEAGPSGFEEFFGSK